MAIQAEYFFPYPPDALFVFLADLRHEPRWNPQLRGVVLLTPEPIGPGSAWRLDHALMPGLEARLTTWEPPHRLGWQLSSESLAMAIRSEFSSTPEGGCTVQTEADVTLQGPLQMVGSIVLAMIQQDFAGRGRRLLAAYEAWRAGSAATS